jgi:D-alanine-D-alanine ligase
VEVFREGHFEKFQQIFFDKGTVYALNGKKGKIEPLFQPDVILNCCHGGWGEGGGVSALAECNQIPLASPEITPSAIFMDKCLTKVVLRGLNIPVVDYIRVNEGDYQKRGAFLLRRIESRLRYPVIVKPAHLGSSIGITVANNEEEAKKAIETAFQLDGRILIEKYLPNKLDVNCAAYALNDEIFVSEPELAFGGGVYSFEEKYVKRTSDGGGGKAQNDKNQRGRYAFKGELREKIRAYTRTVYKRMDLKGVVRMDFLVSGDSVYLCEVNTVPGSLAYYLFCERVTDARIFFTALLEDAIRKVEEKKILSTGILKRVERGRK